MLGGVVLPFVCFLVFGESGGPLLVEWQSGRWNDKLAMMFNGAPARPFYPLLLLAGLAAVALVARPVEMARHVLVRIGVYGGVVLGVMYSVIYFGGNGEAGGLVATFIGCAAVAAIGSWLVQDDDIFPAVAAWVWKHRWPIWIMIGVLLAIAAVASEGVALMLPLVIAIVGAPAVYTLVFAMLTVRIVREYRGGRGEWGVGLWWVVGWCSAYIAALVGGIALAIDSYSKLPTQPPQGCYIATAAARGHRRLVGSRVVVLPGGRSMRVNRQLQTLKCGELALQVAMPRVHRVLRRVYDVLGPPIAGRMGVWSADAAFMLLWPVQRVCEVVLRRVVPGFERRRAGVYGGSPGLANPGL